MEIGKCLGHKITIEKAQEPLLDYLVVRIDGEYVGNLAPDDLVRLLEAP